MPTDTQTNTSNGVETAPTPNVTPTVEVCRICLDSAATIAHRLSSLTRLDPTLAKAAAMAEPDLCIGCCIDLGRQAWAETKRSVNGDSEWAASRLIDNRNKLQQVRP